ncbi:MAG: threonine/serine exporter family protein [Agathobacter sp.]|uniref:threonine/serine exporter family protein n=1 Tax=Agathobacter sp. TaxID=2021311 RepID=UPI00257A3100|nr:threonine/serine exporter family protein [Agathobacter sp.]MBQ1680811.1 threonine/serine exporter family protein [Agathobacter sp.]
MPDLLLTIIIQFVVAGLATFGFAIIFNAPRSESMLCGITGAIGWLVYYLLIHYADFNLVASALIATGILTIFARILAVRRQNPVTLYLMTGIFPLVPGAGIYYTAYYLITDDRSAFASKGTETLEIAIAIVFGIIFGTAIPQVLFHKLVRTKKGALHS